MFTRPPSASSSILLPSSLSHLYTCCCVPLHLSPLPEVILCFIFYFTAILWSSISPILLPPISSSSFISLSAFPLFLPSLYQPYSCFIPQYLLPNDSYLPPSSLPFLLLILSHYLAPYLPLFFPPSSPSLLRLSVSLAHKHQQRPSRASWAEDVYFMLLSYGLMTLNCFICLTSSGTRATRCGVEQRDRSEDGRDGIGRGESFRYKEE